MKEIHHLDASRDARSRIAQSSGFFTLSPRVEKFVLSIASSMADLEVEFSEEAGPRI